MKKLAFLCVVFFIASSSNVFAQSPKFYLETPQGWTRTDTLRKSSNSTLIKLVSPSGLPAKGYKEIIQLLIQQISPRMEALKEKLKEGTELFKVTGDGHITIDNTDADWFEIVLKRPGSETTYSERYYHFEKSGLSYMFIFIVPSEDFSVMQAQVDSILKSFKVLE